MSLNDAIVAGLEGVPGCQAVCYVDMSSGLVLATKSVKSRPQEVLDTYASITESLINSPALKMLKSQLSDGQPKSDDACMVFGKNGLNVFIRAPKYPDHALCYICDDSSNPEEVLAKVKQNQEDVEKAF